MQLEIEVAFEKAAFMLSPRSEQVPCEHFAAANAVDREGASFVAYGTGYPLGCATFRRSGSV
jgi:hypothetical protein